MIAINLGSGQRPFKPPFLNLDINPKWQPDIVCAGENLRMHFGRDSVDLIVAHHVLEHAGCGEADEMLRNCYAALKPGGSLLVFVPNAKALAAAYANDEIPDYIFAVQMMGAYMDSEADRHKWTYSPQSLSETLKKAGAWSVIKPFDWREIPGADIAKDWYIIGMECVK